MLISKLQYLSVALAAGMSLAIPYSFKFQSITIDPFPTTSSTVVNNTKKSVASFFNQTTSMILAFPSTISPSSASSNNYTNSSIGACGPGIGSCPSDLCCR
jgi:hypothetical protein